jgi:hypothetical protein
MPAATATGLCETTHIRPVIQRSASIGKPAGGFKRADAQGAPMRRHDATRHGVRFVRLLMKFIIRHGTRRTADVVAVHAHHDADQGAGARKRAARCAGAQPPVRTLQFDKPDVIGAGPEAKLPQPGGIEDRGRGACRQGPGFGAALMCICTPVSTWRDVTG